MNPRVSIWTAVCCALLPLAARGDNQAAEPTDPKAVVGEYCLTCHDSSLKKGNLSLEGLDPTKPGAQRDTWESVVRKLRAGLMPPAGMPRPARATLDNLRRTVSTALDRDAATLTIPPFTVIHRMNGHEYANAVRDLVGVNVDETILPPDNSTAGFDTVAESLGSSPGLVEAYLSAAAKISRLAVGDPDARPTITYLRLPADESQISPIEGLPLGTRGGGKFTLSFPASGEYKFRTDMLQLQFGPPYGSTARGEEIEFCLDGRRIATQTIRPTAANYAHYTTKTPESFVADFTAWIPAGSHEITVDFALRSSAGVDDEVSPPPSSTSYLPFGIQYGHTTVPHVKSLIIEGPFRPSPNSAPPSRELFYVCHPRAASDETSCARRIVGTLAHRAFRRPVQDGELSELMRFYEQGRAGGTFDRGIRLAVQRVLADPRFTYRIETQPRGAAPGTEYRISAVELASRLSFFLWSSIPDEELLRVAEKGDLGKPAVLEQQLRRMLQHPRALEFVRNFGGQWLLLRDLRNRKPSLPIYPMFSDNVRQGFRRETELLFEHILAEDRSVLEFLDADYTFINEQLAKVYGIPGVYGPDFRRVALSDPQRRGLLGHGSFLMITSTATRTAPVIRGAWVLENLLGSPPPAPPPSVPNLPEPLEIQGKKVEVPSVRQRMMEHRAKQPCNGCHKIMDPLGLALENFDGIGHWRDTDAGLPIDASGIMTDGSALSGPESLRKVLLSYPDAFVETLVEKLLLYAVGRPVTNFDMPEVRAIRQRAAASQNRFSSILLGVVTSRQFQTRTAGARSP